MRSFFVLLIVLAGFLVPEVYAMELKPVPYSSLKNILPEGAASIISETDGTTSIKLSNGVTVTLSQRGHLGFIVKDISICNNVSAGGIILFTPKLAGVVSCYTPGVTTLEVLQRNALENVFDGGLRFQSVRVEGSKAITVYEVVGGNGVLEIELNPSSVEIDGDVWDGFGIVIKLIRGEKGDRYVSSLVNRLEVEFGGPSDSYYVWGHTPYGIKRGFHESLLASDVWQGKLSFENTQFESQAFTLVSGGNRTHLSYIEPAVIADNQLEVTRSGYAFETRYRFGVKSGDMATPVQHHLFLNRAVKSDEYSALSWHINRHLRGLAGLPPLDGVPIAMASKDNQINWVINWRKYADKVLPIVKNLGFKRVFAGMNPSKTPQYPFEYPAPKKTFTDFRFFNDRAHLFGIQTILWVTTCTADYRARIVSDHPEWVVMQQSGSAAHYHNLPDVLVMYPGETYINWLLEQVRNLREKTGFDGLWLDSCALASKLVDVSGKDPQGLPANRIVNYVKKLTNDGIVVYAEGLTPYALSSFWIRKNLYSSYSEREYSLTGTSPLTNRPDSDFVSYFIATSYKCYPLFDIQPFIDKESVYSDQINLEQEVRLTNIAINNVNAVLGSLAIPRTFSNGVYWVSPKGIAIFIHRRTTQLVLKDIVASGDIRVFNCLDLKGGGGGAVRQVESNIVANNFDKGAIILIPSESLGRGIF